MIDDGELDWKIIAISTADPLADKLNDVEDVERCARAVALQQVLLRSQAAWPSVWLHRASLTSVIASALPCGNRTLPAQRSLQTPGWCMHGRITMYSTSHGGHTCILYDLWPLWLQEVFARQPTADLLTPCRYRQNKSDLMRRRAALRQCTNCRTATARRETDRPGRHLRPASL